jgi:hypothetical protein
VLRDSSGTPLDGAWHTIFRFFSAETGGDEILIDEHPNASEKEVLVSNGLFSVALGSGNLFDGSGPGVYGSLAEVFRDHGTVWLEVEIDGEVLTPRARVISAAYALNADHLDGRTAADFIDTSSIAQAKYGPLTVNSPSSGTFGVTGYGRQGGGQFWDSDASGYAYVGYAHHGIDSYGNVAGGYFKDLDHSGHAYVGVGDQGIRAHGSDAAGYFEDLDESGYAFLGIGHFGIEARGNSAGGAFFDRDDSGYAFVANDEFGIKGYGNEAGGYFEDLNGSSTVWVARNDNGLSSYGSQMGGYFSDTGGTAYARIASREGEFDSYGIHAFGDSAGGFFEDRDAAGYAKIGVGDWGVDGYGGTDAGGGVRGSDLTSGCWGALGHYNSSTDGNCAKNFVQNHPYEEDRMIVYSSLEGDEVGTYTRGSARLENGVAQVRLGETFQWVTNPDLGLTAHLSPRGQAASLYVESLSTREMIVRAEEGTAPDAAFDYIVHGLRIGFEESSVVREKSAEAYLPSMVALEESYEQFPGLRRFNALERFKAMAAQTHGSDAMSFDLSAAETLRAAIQEYDPEVHGPIGDRPSVPADLAGRDRDPRPAEPRPSAETGEDRVDPAAPAALITETAPSEGAEDGSPEAGKETLPGGASLFPVSEAVELGDLLALDPDRPGSLRRAASLADPSVIGIAAAEPVESEGVFQVPVLGAGFATVKADASYGAVLAGDLLTSSLTPGHAMVAIDALPGTVIGKALEPLDSGTGLVRVLVIPR